MILLSAVIAGALAGWGYARWNGRVWHPPVFRMVWLVFLGFLPQLIAFYLPYTRHLLPDGLVASGLILSQVTLLIFALVNIRLPGLLVLSIGLALNLAVILVNGGFMPLPLETAARFVDPTVLNRLDVGGRISNASKDILLPESRIALPWLADRFVFSLLPFYRFAFSLGDIFVAAGAFWMLIGRQRAMPRIKGDI